MSKSNGDGRGISIVKAKVVFTASGAKREKHCVHCDKLFVGRNKCCSKECAEARVKANRKRRAAQAGSIFRKNRYLKEKRARERGKEIP